MTMNKSVFLVLSLLVFAILIPGCLTKTGFAVPGKTNDSTSAKPTNLSATNAPNSKIASVEKWDDMQMKFTYVGSQEKFVPSIGISLKPFDMSKFQNITPGIDYGNDVIQFTEIVITSDEMQTLVIAVFDKDFMRAPKASEDPAISFMFYNATNGITSEFLLSAQEGKTLADTYRPYLRFPAKT